MPEIAVNDYPSGHPLPGKARSNALLYEISALEVIKNTTMGRPKKPETSKSKPAKKSAKPKKIAGQNGNRKSKIIS
jgi:hypothetical protein